MSFGDLEYQSTSSHFLTRLLKSLKQEQIILDAVQNPIDDVEEYPDSRLVESQIGTKDTLGAVSKQITDTWVLPSEPSYKTKLWLWFREGWRLKDHSCRGNEAFVEQIEPSPYAVENYVPIKRKVIDDAITDGRYYSITDGLSQYIRVKDGPDNRITDLLVSETSVSFSIFFSPFKEYVMDDNSRIPIFSKLDDDQILNAIRVTADADGKIYYDLIYKGDSYHVETASNNIISVITAGEFTDIEFDPAEFNTENPTLQQTDPDVAVTDWTWLFFTFNKTTRQLSIYKVADGGFTATLLVQGPADETGMRTNFSAHLPMNEGGTDAVTAYDIINSNNAVFAASPNAPTFVSGGGGGGGGGSSRVLRFANDTQRALIANHTSINALSVFTIAFKLRVNQYAQTATADHIILKGYSGNGTGAHNAGAFKVFLGGNASPTALGFIGTSDAGTLRSVSKVGLIPALNTWYNVVITYNGTNYVIDVLGVDTHTSATMSGDVFTHSDSLYLGSTNHGAWVDLSDLIIVKGTAWGASEKTWFQSRTVGFKALDLDWKPPKPPVPEEPVPVVRPQSVVYDLQLADSAETVKVNLPAATTPFVSQYNVAGGTPSTTTEELKYDVADGTSGGSSTNPSVTVYSLSPVNSTGTLNSSEDAVGQYIMDAASAIEGIKPTEITMYLKTGSSTPSGGNLYLGIIKANGTTVKFGSAIPPASLSSSYTGFTRQGNNVIGSQYTTVVGDAIGVIWEGGSSGSVNIQRGGSNVHDDTDGSGNPLSAQTRYDSGWGTPNEEFSLAGIIKTGGETVSGTNPYFKLTANNWVAANYQINSTLENIPPTRVIWRVRRVGSAASATLQCVVRQASNGAVVATIGSAVSFNSIGTTLQDLEFINRDNLIGWADGYRITLEYVNKTGINETTVYLEVNYNVGPSNAGIVGGNTIKAQYYKSTATAGYYDISPQGTDWAGKIYIGGATFTSYKTLDNLTTRVAEKVHQATSPNISRIFGDKLSKWNAILKKEGNPTGMIKIKIFNASGAEVAVFNTQLDAEGVTTSDVTYVFTFPTNNYPMALNDRIAVVYENGTATDKILVKINTDAAGGANADGTKSILSTFKSGAWTDETLYDVAGEMFTGGVPDLTSRPKVAIRCDSEFSQIMQDKITKAEFKLKKLGAPTGTYYIRSVRGSDGSNRDLIGSGNIASLSATAYTTITVSNFLAVHYLGVSDKIVIEFEGGDANNCLLVQVKKNSTYDDEDTRYEEYNGVTWSTEGFQTWDLAGKLWVGGDTYTPDAGQPYVEPPDYYEHDLIIAGEGADHLENVVDTFYSMRLRDFRIYTEILSLAELDILYSNKYSKTGDRGKLALLGFFTLTDQLTE